MHVTNSPNISIQGLSKDLGEVANKCYHIRDAASTQCSSFPHKEILVNESTMSYGDEMTNVLQLINYDKSPNDEDSLNVDSHEALCTPIIETEHINSQENQASNPLSYYKVFTDTESSEMTPEWDFGGLGLDSILKGCSATPSLQTKLSQIPSETFSDLNSEPISSCFETKFDTVNTNFCDYKKNVLVSATLDMLKDDFRETEMVNESTMSYGDEMTNVLQLINYDKSPNDEDSLNVDSHEALCTPIIETEHINSQEYQASNPLSYYKVFTDTESSEMTPEWDFGGLGLDSILKGCSATPSLQTKLSQIPSETFSDLNSEPISSCFETKFDTVNTNFCDYKKNVLVSATLDMLKDDFRETEMKANLERSDKDLNPVINENPLPEPHDHHTSSVPQLHLNAASLSVHEPHNLHTSSVPEPRNHHASSVSEQGNIVHHHASSVSEQGNIVQIASPKDNDLISKAFEAATSAKPVWIIIPAKIIGQSPNSLANSDDAIKDSIPASPPKTMRHRRASKRPWRFDDFQSSASGEEEDQRRSSADEEGQRRSSEQLSEAEKFRRMRLINNISSKKCRYKKKMRLRALEDDIQNEKAEHVKLLNMLEQWELKKQKWKELVMSISAKKN